MYQFYSYKGCNRQAHNCCQKTESKKRGGLPLPERDSRTAIQEGCQDKNTKRESRQKNGSHECPPTGEVLSKLVQEQEIPFGPWAVLRGEIDLPADRRREQDRQDQDHLDRKQRDECDLEKVIGEKIVFCISGHHTCSLQFCRIRAPASVRPHNHQSHASTPLFSAIYSVFRYPQFSHSPRYADPS